MSQERYRRRGKGVGSFLGSIKAKLFSTEPEYVVNNNAREIVEYSSTADTMSESTTAVQPKRAPPVVIADATMPQKVPGNNAASNQASTQQTPPIHSPASANASPTGQTQVYQGSTPMVGYQMPLMMPYFPMSYPVGSGYPMVVPYGYMPQMPMLTSEPFSPGHSRSFDVSPGINSIDMNRIIRDISVEVTKNLQQTMKLYEPVHVSRRRKTSSKKMMELSEDSSSESYSEDSSESSDNAKKATKKHKRHIGAPSAKRMPTIQKKQEPEQPVEVKTSPEHKQISAEITSFMNPIEPEQQKFSFNTNDAPLEPETTTSKPAQAEPSPEPEKVEPVQEQAPAPTFSFNFNTTKSSGTSLFNFDSKQEEPKLDVAAPPAAEEKKQEPDPVPVEPKKEEQKENNAFSFGSGSGMDIGNFSFGNIPSAFNLGENKPETQNTTEPAPADNTQAPAPMAFNFGGDTNMTAPQGQPFNFSSPAPATEMPKQENTSIFSFGNTATSLGSTERAQKTEPNNMFNFGSGASAFGAGNMAAPADNGSTNASAPFTFGSAANEQQNSQFTFNFGPPSTEQTSGFSANNNQPMGFGMGQPANTGFGMQNNAGNTDQPASTFSFGAPSNSVFSFGQGGTTGDAQPFSFGPR